MLLFDTRYFTEIKVRHLTNMAPSILVKDAMSNSNTKCHTRLSYLKKISRCRKFCRLQHGKHDCDKMDIDDVDLSFVRNMIDKVDDHTEIKFLRFIFHTLSVIDSEGRRIQNG